MARCRAATSPAGPAPMTATLIVDMMDVTAGEKLCPEIVKDITVKIDVLKSSTVHMVQNTCLEFTSLKHRK